MAIPADAPTCKEPDNAGNSYCGKSSGIKVKVTQTARNTSDALLRTDEQYLDGLGRLRFTQGDSLESGMAIVEQQYDEYGQVSQRSQPYFSGGSVYWTSFTYDLLGRLTEQDAPVSESQSSGRTTTMAYEGRDVEVTDPLSHTTTRTRNVIGQLKAVTDPSPGGTTTYSYRPFGEVATITDAASNVTSWSYNVRGFVTATSDPDAGSWSYVPNAFGELTSQTDAKSQTVSFTYDKLSRPLTRVESEGTTTWTWGALSDNDATHKYVGRLKSIASPGSYSETNTFDAQSRLTHQSIVADGSTYVIDRTYYSTTGLPATLEYPTSTSSYRLKLYYEYANNMLQKVRDYNGSTIFWQATSTDAWGHVQDETFGNGVQTFTDFDQANGWMEAREGGVGGGTGLINATTSWDKNGNLTERQDLKQTLTEHFYYDNLNRFDYSTRNGTTNQDVTLDAIGNILWKKDVCPSGSNCYSYHATKKRAVVAAGSYSYGYDANGNMTSRNGSSISYTSYNLPSVINAGSNSSTLSYGAFRNRYKQVSLNAGTYETTIYIGGILEKVSRSAAIEYRHLIMGGKGVAAIYTRRTAGSPLNDTYYVHADQLGSPEMITDASGNQVVKLSFGAYGERRGSNWTGTPSSGDWTAIGNTTRHGFTWHEHLDSVGLTHMNGRVYDPVVARFLTRDPYIDGWDSTQGTNGYAYVHNNPLAFTDPSGFEADEDTIPRHRDEGGGGDPRLWHGWTDWAILEAQVIYGLQTHSIGMTIDVCPDGGFECQPGTTTSSPWSTPTVDLAWTWRETRSPFNPIGFDRQPGGPKGHDNPPNVDSPPQRGDKAKKEPQEPPKPPEHNCAQGGVDTIITGAEYGAGLGALAGARIGYAFGIAELPGSLLAAASVDGLYGVILAAGAFADVGGYTIAGAAVFGVPGIVAGVVVAGAGVYLFNQYQTHYGGCHAP